MTCAALIATLTISIAPGHAVTAPQGTYFVERTVALEQAGYVVPLRWHWNNVPAIVYTRHGRRVATFNGITFRNFSRKWLHVMAELDRL